MNKTLNYQDYSKTNKDNSSRDHNNINNHGKRNTKILNTKTNAKNNKDIKSTKTFSDKNPPKYFKIIHQNIRGIIHKTDEFLIPILEISPQVICLTEHHLRLDELKSINLSPYILGTQSCRQTYKQGGTAIFISQKMQFHTINLEHFNKEKDLETCALKISLPQKTIIIICIYRSPTGNFKYFINQLELMLISLYKVTTHIIICGDFNINHLEKKLKNCSITISFSLV